MSEPATTAHSRVRIKKSTGTGTPGHTNRAAAAGTVPAPGESSPAPLTSVVIDGVRVELGDLPALVELDMPREGVPEVISSQPALERCAAALAAGHGPAAVDTERASGFRYGQRAFLVQIRRDGAGTWLIDPEAFDGLQIINDALRGTEWILHAAAQDLPCLAEVGMWPDKLFDTELAARLAGLPRVGLGAVVESLLGYHLAKEHSAADWSRRPLPEPWLRYAALDVEVLAELEEELVALLEADGKLDYAAQEFQHLIDAGVPAARVDPWRRTSGSHTIRNRVQLAAVRELWYTRDKLAEHRDIAPGRLIPDSAIIAAAKAMPTTVPALLALAGFHGRTAKRDAPKWLHALQTAKASTDLPPLQLATNAPPPPRVWAERDAAAAARLATVRPRLAALAELLDIPAENLLTPDHLRRICWRPPQDITEESVAAGLAELGARQWQIEKTAPLLAEAMAHPEPLAPRHPRHANKDDH
ncbi:MULTISPECIES: HRDC domain-containing protein [unclassified Arthrobacter]|uniref:HRDC domain-containing protein n=1 Tax=unclassified Arthrobacter TaxID=235627 RepID=UPI00159D616F|nr:MULTISPECIES: HRDC domain-containing protein [unclassified Arthrobacter]MCQ9164061.1 HRDC domain-containing protein [Arthrobacter sp. STN4]NVM97857.1 ribonuclease D [Arthrobacter sp. SDTb3-6]